MYKQYASEKFIVINKKTEKFFDYALLSGKFHAVWTDNLKSAQIYESKDDSEIFECLDACGVDFSEVEVISLTVTLKVEYKK